MLEWTNGSVTDGEHLLDKLHCCIMEIRSFTQFHSMACNISVENSAHPAVAGSLVSIANRIIPKT